MAFIVTARKWRPQIFNDVAGQEHITSTLKNALRANRIAHAFIFTGPRGVGKTTTARILAKTLNCLNPVDFEPCNICEMCTSIQNNQSMDILEIDGASNRGIDEIRTLRDSVKYAPSRGKYKVYIIDEVHMLTKEAFNAFLKTLEEPPPHTIFIFATTDIQKVPLTIISRCQRFDFRRIQLNTIKNLLSKIAKGENVEIDDKTLTVIARKADGALRDAESFFDQVVSFCGTKIDFETASTMLNLIDDAIYFNVSDAILEKDFRSVFTISDTVYNRGYDFIDFMNGLVEHFRNILTVVITGKTDFLETAEIFMNKYLAYNGKYSQGDLLRILNFLNKTLQEMKVSQNHKLKIEISLSHLVGLEKSSTISEIIDSIDSDNAEIVMKDSEKKKYESSLNPEISLIKPAATLNSESSHSDAPSDKIPEVIPPAASKKKPGTSPLTANKEKEVDFETITEKWNSFVNAVKAEKGLTLGTYVTAARLAGFEGNKIKIVLNDEMGRKSFHYDYSYLEKKCTEIFGRRLKFVFEDSKQELNEGDYSANQVTKEVNDPIVNLIINELGGEEIS